MFKRLNEGEPEHISAPTPGHAPSPIDLQYKVKTDEMTREDFHLVKHIGPNYFAMPVGLAGLALAFRTVSQLQGVSDTVWQVLAIISGTVFGLLFILYLLKLVLYPRKVRAAAALARMMQPFWRSLFCRGPLFWFRRPPPPRPSSRPRVSSLRSTRSGCTRCSATRFPSCSLPL